MRSLQTAQVQPLNITAWVGKTVMMIAAHPDDIEATAGGTIAQLTAQGTRVVYVIMTNGDKGCTTGSIYNCTGITAEQIAYIRHGEAIAVGSWVYWL
jgi:LmbE family N-acetylglucosaminyl deacetylase